MGKFSINANNKEDFKKAKLFKGFGVDKTFDQRKIPGEYDVISIGLNFRMTEMHHLSPDTSRQ